MGTIGVILVDDSAVVRQVTSDILKKDLSIKLIATASDPVFAFEHMRKQWPDVIVTDIEMPRMDGITFIKRVMQEKPTPIIVCSSLTEKGAETSLNAMAAGAVEIITKPKNGLKNFLENYAKEYLEIVKSASKVNIKNVRQSSSLQTPHSIVTSKSPDSDLVSLSHTTDKVIAIGTSTGGTQALEQVLVALPRTVPGIVIVQHMPEKFTASFAARLNSLCALEVSEAMPDQRVIPGRVLIAPGGKHMQLKKNGAQYCVDISDGPLVKRHKPSVDVLFRSVAKHAGKNALGIIMTGMGDDGAAGMYEMKQSGSITIAQDEESSVVFGMPKEAIKKGAVDKVMHLQNIASEIIAYAN